MALVDLYKAYTRLSLTTKVLIIIVSLIIIFFATIVAFFIILLIVSYLYSRSLHKKYDYLTTNKTNLPVIPIKSNPVINLIPKLEIIKDSNIDPKTIEKSSDLEISTINLDPVVSFLLEYYKFLVETVFPGVLKMDDLKNANDLFKLSNNKNIKNMTINIETNDTAIDIIQKLFTINISDISEIRLYHEFEPTTTYLKFIDPLTIVWENIFNGEVDPQEYIKDAEKLADIVIASIPTLLKPWRFWKDVIPAFVILYNNRNTLKDMFFKMKIITSRDNKNTSKIMISYILVVFLMINLCCIKLLQEKDKKYNEKIKNFSNISLNYDELYQIFLQKSKGISSSWPRINEKLKFLDMYIIKKIPNDIFNAEELKEIIINIIKNLEEYGNKS